MNDLTKAEQAALSFYIGDAHGDDAFYGDKKAYVTLNSLFFPDIRSERARADEGKRLNPAVFDDIPRLVGFFESLFSAFRKSALTEDVTTYRVERMSDYVLSRQRGATVSLTSTSLAGFLGAYRDRKGIALMGFEIPAGSHCLDAAAVLGHYAKPEEAEILLPPFMGLDITEIPLSDAEKAITDSDGNAPEVSCIARLTGMIRYSGDAPELPELDGAAQRICNALNCGKTPETADVEHYSRWKECLWKILNKMI